MKGVDCRGQAKAAFADNPDDRLPELEHQYTPSVNRTKAFEFLFRVGGQTVERASYAEAESYVAAAPGALAAVPESPKRDARELRVRRAFAQSIAAAKGWSASAAGEMAARARALA